MPVVVVGDQPAGQLGPQIVVVPEGGDHVGGLPCEVALDRLRVLPWRRRRRLPRPADPRGDVVQVEPGGGHRPVERGERRQPLALGRRPERLPHQLGQPVVRMMVHRAPPIVTQ